MKRDKYCLFGIIPLLYIEKYDDLTLWKLFKFIPLITIQYKFAKKIVKLFGITIIKICETSYCSTWTYKILRFLATLPTKRNIVLITDNLREPNNNIVDNFTLFEYLCNSKNQKLKPLYILHKSSPYYNEIKNKYKNKILGFNDRPSAAFKLRLISLMPYLKYACDSYNALDALQLNLNAAIKKSKNVFSIFTQHGITYFKPEFIRPTVYGIEMFDYVTVSNDMEKEIFIEKGCYPEERIIPNGLFRWDKLVDLSQNTVEKSIFVFFTQRAYLKKVSNIQNCDYIKEINKIINNTKLQEILSNNNIKLKIGIHHSATQQINSLINSKNVIIISEDDIEQVKQEASLLLTDYSSMCFEFFHQNKPVIFYNIDDSVDCKLYRSMGDMVNPYYDKEQELFNITKTSEEVCKLLVKYIENDFQCEKEILEKEAKFFYYKSDFCKRFEKFMIEHLNSKK